MVKATITSFLLLFLFNSSIFAEQAIVNVDGREVLLNDNGRWQYRSNDRFAVTADGRRVRLKDDGSWQYIGNAPLVSNEQVRTNELDINLDKVVIEKHETKVQKNTRLRTQTVFHLNMEYSSSADTDLSIANDTINNIEVRDNQGKNYKVLSIRPAPARFKPGTEISVVIRAEKSPSIWSDARSMEITFNPGILGISKPITLSQRVIDFEEEKVDGFQD
jgi:hypothetical protein